VEEALQESRATIQALIDAVPESMLLLDSKGTVLALNEIAAQRMDKSKEGILGLSVFDFLSSELAEKRAENLKQVTASGKQLCFTDERNGRNFYCSLEPVLSADGNVVKVAVFAQDLTMQLETELALRESEQRFKSIFENAPIGFYRSTPEGRILDANPATIKMLGYSSFDELAAIDLESQEYLPLYRRSQFRERIERDGEIKGMESFWRRKDNTLVYIRENARAIRDADGTVVCYEGTVEDITAKKQAEEQIRTLGQQLLQAQEAERQMISRELHDSIAQDLSVLRLGLDALFDNQPPPHREVSQKISKLIEMLEEAIARVRHLSYDLRPPGLKEMGLVTALSMLCEQFSEKSEVAVDFHAAGMKSLKLDFNTEINIYRLIQEGLTNIQKHAEAQQVTVRLLRASPNIVLRIEDDGKGFDVAEQARSAIAEKRIGLRSMTERVNLLQGKMTVQSRPMNGTKIVIKLPCPENWDDSKKDHIDR
jgi:PAS domain S-box-containing protein